MRHGKRSDKMGRNTSHRRCLKANMLKSLIQNEKITTTEAKAKVLRRYADAMITLAKSENKLAARRRAIAEMMIRFNKLTSKQTRAAKNGNTSSYNDDRVVIGKLFDVLGPRFATRQGGYTRITRTGLRRRGDNSAQVVLEYLPE